MSKEFLSQCPEIIHQAEYLRTKGKHEVASILVRDARVPGASVVGLPDSELSDLMRAWRIDVVANTSAAKRSWNGKKAVTHLREAHGVIYRYYDNPYVLKRAPEIKKDNEGHPYDFEAEMLRDKGRYCLVAAALTGNLAFIDAAKDLFLKASIVEAQEYSPRGLGLARMELGITVKNFELIRSGYEGTYLRSVTWGNLDRARWAARTYFGESVKSGKLRESFKALRDLAKVRRNPVKILADCAIGITRSSEILSAPINWLRRHTLPRNFNSESLKI